MSKKDELISKYHGEMDKMGIKYDTAVFANVFTACGPSVYNADASKVSSSDEKELDTVRTNFIGNKLGVSDEKKANDAIAAVVDIMGASNKNKYRAIFYYLLAKELNKASMFN